MSRKDRSREPLALGASFMADTREIQSEITQVKSLQNLVDSYEQIASARMKRTRESVLVNREFLAEINEVFEEVRRSYVKEVLTLAKQRKRTKTITFLAHNGKTVSLFLSANTGLYGDIVKRTFEEFIKEAETGSTEVTIVGRNGLAIFLSELPDAPYTYFDLPDHNVRSDQLSEIIRHVVEYEEIHVFHGKYINVVKQVPTKLTVSAEISLEENVRKGAKEFDYIFEPNLEKILEFFETEIFASLFEQAVRESELAKYASRFLAMDSAIGNIKDKLKALKFEKLRAQHYISNKKQLNQQSGVYKYVGVVK